MPACTFIGHTDFSESNFELIYDTVKYLIEEENVTTFYVGTHGNVVILSMAKNFSQDPSLRSG